MPLLLAIRLHDGKQLFRGPAALVQNTTALEVVLLARSPGGLRHGVNEALERNGQAAHVFIARGEAERIFRKTGAVQNNPADAHGKTAERPDVRSDLADDLLYFHGDAIAESVNRQELRRPNIP